MAPRGKAVTAVAAAAVVLGALLGAVSSGIASPPVCVPSLAGLFIAADAVVEAALTDAQARAETRRGERRRFVSASYQVVDVFKGRLADGERVRLVKSCIDAPVPAEFAGYPMVERYCRGDIGLDLDGVRLRGDGAEPDRAQTWILFLERHEGEWRPIAKSVSYRPDRCLETPERVPVKDRPQFERLRLRPM
jgi:hypothetical protein